MHQFTNIQPWPAKAPQEASATTWTATAAAVSFPIPARWPVPQSQQASLPIVSMLFQVGSCSSMVAGGSTFLQSLHTPSSSKEDLLPKLLTACLPCPANDNQALLCSLPVAQPSSMQQAGSGPLISCTCCSSNLRRLLLKPQLAPHAPATKVIENQGALCPPAKSASQQRAQV